MATHTVKGLLGQPVITQSTGRRVGSIQEILYETCHNRVSAIVLSKPPVSGTAKAVSAEHIILLGVDVTLIDSEESVASLTVPSPDSCHARASTGVIRTQVITANGKRLGEVADITLDEKGNVLGYRLSHSIVRDALRGKPFIPVESVMAVGEDAVLVQPDALQTGTEEEEPGEVEEAASEEGDDESPPLSPDDESDPPADRGLF